MLLCRGNSSIQTIQKAKMSSKSKKQTMADLRSKKHYQCQVCKKWCNDDYTLDKESGKSTCGQMERKETVYFCSEKCSNYQVKYYYFSTMIPNEIKNIDNRLKKLMPFYAIYLKREHKANEPNPLFVIKAFRAMRKFLEALTLQKTMQELTLYKHQVNKALGDALEECHREQNIIDVICVYIKLVKHTELELFSN